MKNRAAEYVTNIPMTVCSENTAITTAMIDKTIQMRHAAFHRDEGPRSTYTGADWGAVVCPAEVQFSKENVSTAHAFVCSSLKLTFAL